jgi:hypothetical protein
MFMGFGPKMSWTRMDWTSLDLDLRRILSPIALDSPQSNGHAQPHKIPTKHALWHSVGNTLPSLGLPACYLTCTAGSATELAR